MIPEITDKNVFLLLPGKVSAVVGKYVDENAVDLLDGLRKFYNSMTYKNLECEQTKMWHLGPVALYQMFNDEIVTDTL
ncbi:MAG: hypothetical protein IJV25_03280 [Prevotella sp.]|nr:hypothetical protein [Prevotella sp.]